jgi:sugar O-acyltransferase (sialic acid O-acetyltransferase NeuD family)
MLKNDLVLIGAGGHARSCIDVIEQEGKYAIGGLVGLSQEVGFKQFGYKVITADSALALLAKQFPYALIAVGQIQSAELRIRLYEQYLSAGFIFPTIISSSAYVSTHSTIGAGTIVMHGAVINAGAVVGENCIINSQALIEHDSHVADHCHISTGAILNGDTAIGARSFIGSGAIIKEGVSVGAGSLIGMGLTVRHELDENSRFMGGATS